MSSLSPAVRTCYGIAIAALLYSLSACVPPKPASLKVVGGQSITDHAAVILLKVDAAKHKICTGTVVSHNTVLMAGHCVKDPSLQEGVLYADRVRSSKIYTWLKLKDLKLLSEAEAARDLAIVVFPDQTFPGPHPVIRFAPLSKEELAAERNVQVVGFGADEFGKVPAAIDVHVKRRGYNKLATSSDSNGLLTLRTKMADISASRAMMAAGDSGGPLFDMQDRIVAVAAGMYFEDASGAAIEDLRFVGPDGKDSKPETDDSSPMPVLDDAVTSVNLFVDLTSLASRKLMTYAVESGIAQIPSLTAALRAPLDDTDEDWRRPPSAAGLFEGKHIIALCGGGGGFDNGFNGGFQNGFQQGGLQQGGFQQGGFQQGGLQQGGLQTSGTFQGSYSSPFSSSNYSRTTYSAGTYSAGTYSAGTYSGTTASTTFSGTTFSGTTFSGTTFSSSRPGFGTPQIPGKPNFGGPPSPGSSTEATAGQTLYKRQDKCAQCHAQKKSAAAWRELVSGTKTAPTSMTAIMSDLSAAEKSQIQAYLDSNLP